MSERMQVATRKGLFTLTRNNSNWNIASTAFLGSPVSNVLHDARDGAMSVTHTRDGGKNWETFRSGLPQRDAYDLINRHGLDVDEASTRLAMGFTIGVLWLSDDAGERWQLVNAHLPPIYAVHFH